jgi:syntaxin 5
VQQQSEFARKASQIGLTIHKTSVKLQKLAQLAKSSSLFDDRSAEIDELTGVVKQDIQALNSAIAELQQLSAARGDANRQSADHSHTVVDSLRSRLKDATAEFKDVLTLRTENLKVHKERKQQYSTTPDARERAPQQQQQQQQR